jgi:hypothetical protein
MRNWRFSSPTFSKGKGSLDNEYWKTMRNWRFSSPTFSKGKGSLDNGCVDNDNEFLNKYEKILKIKIKTV